MTLARQRVLSSSEVRASDLEHGGSWVRIPSGAQIFSVSSYGWFFTSPFISFIKQRESRKSIEKQGKPGENVEKHGKTGRIKKKHRKTWENRGKRRKTRDNRENRGKTCKNIRKQGKHRENRRIHRNPWKFLFILGT